MNKDTVIKTVVEVAMKTDINDPIDFEMFLISKESFYNIIASKFVNDGLKFNLEDRYIISLATAVHLFVENVILRQKIHETLEGKT
jgi:hypothetical protein